MYIVQQIEHCNYTRDTSYQESVPYFTIKTSSSSSGLYLNAVASKPSSGAAGALK